MSDRQIATPLDARLARSLEGGPSFPLGSRLYRALWRLAWAALAAWSPPFMHAWRRLVLKLFGARMAPGARVYASVRIWDPRNLAMGVRSCLGPRVDCYSMASVSLADGAIVSQDACLCAGSHDIDDPAFQLVAKSIVIGERAWIAAGAFVGPGVSVGEGAVLGARGVAFSDLEAWSVHIGNPARRLRRRESAKSDSGDAVGEQRRKRGASDANVSLP
jgi:putative colanic acid biosynthesis acetyltransferase WcaF